MPKKDKGELTEPSAVVEEKAPKVKKVKKVKVKVPKVPKEKPTPVVFATQEINECNIKWAIGEIGGEGATVNAIRKRLGQPVNPTKEPKITWAADAIRSMLKPMVGSGAVVDASKGRQGLYKVA